MIGENTFEYIDPDMHHFNNLYPSTIDEDSVMHHTLDSYNSNIVPTLNNHFKILHSNIMSLFPKLDAFFANFSRCKISFDAFCFSETFQ